MKALVLQLDGMKVPVKTTRASRNARLTMEADGSLRLLAAEDVSTDELSRFLESKRAWIYRKLAEKEALHSNPVTKELVDGEGFLYLGRNHRLLLSDAASRVGLHRGRLIVPRNESDARNGARLIINWYQERGEAWLRPRTPEWANRLLVGHTRITVGALGHKWGATLPDGRIRIHWATLQLSPRLIDYVLVHELAHLREPHHGPDFWALVSRVLPDYDVRKTELARRGGALWMGGIN